MLTSTPYSNLLTYNQYRSLLTTAGYEPSSIEIEDISKDVFEPLSRFLGRQDTSLRAIGQNIGVFRVAKLLFGWWARTGIVRACVVVARRKS